MLGRNDTMVLLPLFGMAVAIVAAQPQRWTTIAQASLTARWVERIGFAVKYEREDNHQFAVTIRTMTGNRTTMKSEMF